MNTFDELGLQENILKAIKELGFENPMPVQDDTRILVTSHTALTYAHQQSPDPALKAQPTDLERRWYKPGGYDLTLDV